MNQRKFINSGRHEFWGWLVGVLLLSTSLFYLVEDFAYAGKVFPGVHLGDLDLSGKTVAEAEQLIVKVVKKLPQQTLTFNSAGFSRNYTLKELGVVFSTSQIVQKATAFGREPRQPLLNLVERLQAATVGIKLSVPYQEQLDLVDWVTSALREKVDRVGVDGDVLIKEQTARIRPAVTGRILDGTELRKILQQRSRTLDWSPIDLPIQLAPPLFNDELTQLTADTINQYFVKGYILKARERQWILSLKQLWQLVEVIKQSDSLVVRLQPQALADYLRELAIEVDQSVQDAVWVMKDKRVIKFRPDQPGVNLQETATLELIQSTLLTTQRELELPADYIEPKIKLAALNDLGVTELVAHGESNFSGSPKNRRHNIKIGAGKFDLVLVPPNEKFSFNKTLGEVMAETGYLEELVIKGDETTPEFGGGLCQVSTTAFRAALWGGYPILERHNHTYRVSYYEPAGMDATVYQPYPDLKFLNDTPYHILVHTYIDIEKSNLYFDFYSTKTGQRVELEGPRIYNITEPPLPVYIETSDLSEGEEKKIDTAHRGAEATLYRHIYDDRGKEIRKDTFKSFYIPWPAKYLRGAKAAPKVETNLGNIPPEGTAVETPPNTLLPHEQ